ncbi:MAG: hypothetical protein EBZ51_07725 [Synechococcaceae bacterium WB9_2_112]|nr:hypothetical protein [Synechococcaceae bacterium WB9_2_112]
MEADRLRLTGKGPLGTAEVGKPDRFRVDRVQHQQGVDHVPGDLPRCWPTSAIARCLGGGPPPLAALVKGLQQRGHRAAASGVMPSQVRSDAPWTVILEVAAGLTQAQDC